MLKGMISSEEAYDEWERGERWLKLCPQVGERGIDLKHRLKEWL